MNGHTHQAPQPHKAIKRVENLPRTGIEYPYIKDRRQFIQAHKEFEPLSEQIIPNFLLDEYIKNDGDHACASVGQFPVVYDCIEPSQYYEDPNDPYYDERDSIELPAITDQTEGLVNEPYQKKYLFNPYNPPYQLEKPICIQQTGSTAGPANGQQENKLYDKRGVPRINRYYEKLKPYYKLHNTEQVIDRTLIFESRFESGNLKRAVKV